MFNPQRKDNNPQNQLSEHQLRLEAIRDNQHKSIRQTQKSKVLIKNRQKLLRLQELNAQNYKLFEIDCVGNLQKILAYAKQMKNPRPNQGALHNIGQDQIEKALHQTLIYACSKQSAHIFSMLTEQVVEALVEILKKPLADSSDSNYVVSDFIKKAVKYSLWILQNYTCDNHTSETSNFDLYSRLISICTEYLHSNVGLYRQLALSNLTNLLEAPQHRDPIIYVSLPQIIKKHETFEPQSVACFAVRFFEGLQISKFLNSVVPFCDNFQGLPNPIRFLVDILIQNIQNPNSKVVVVSTSIQALSNLLDCQTNTYTVLAEFEDIIVRILNWAMSPVQAELKSTSMQLSKTIQRILRDILDSFYAYNPTETQEDHYSHLLRNLTLSHTLRLFWKYENPQEYNTKEFCSPEERKLMTKITENLYDLISNIFCWGELADIFFEETNNSMLNHLMMGVESVQSGTAKMSIIQGLCNLVLTASEVQTTILVERYGVLKMLSQKLYSYQDADLNLLIMKSLKEIFKIGQMVKEEREYHRNLYFQEFISYGGMKGLNELEVSKNEKLAKYACSILETYEEEYKYLYEDA